MDSYSNVFYCFAKNSAYFRIIHEIESYVRWISNIDF